MLQHRAMYPRDGYPHHHLLASMAETRSQDESLCMVCLKISATDKQHNFSYAFKIQISLIRSGSANYLQLQTRLKTNSKEF